MKKYGRMETELRIRKRGRKWKFMLLHTHMLKDALVSTCSDANAEWTPETIADLLAGTW